MRIVFCDTETTGLDSSRAAIVSYALAVWNDGEVTARVSRKVMPHAGAEITPKAVQVNGYHPDDWKAAGAMAMGPDDLKTFHEYLSGAVVGGSNVAFDKGFIAAACERLGGKPPRWNHRDADTGKIAFPLWAAGLVESTGLESLVKYFDLGNVYTKPHDAECDVNATIAVFEALCDLLLFKPARWREALEEVSRFSPGAGAGQIARKALGG